MRIGNICRPESPIASRCRPPGVSQAQGGAGGRAAELVVPARQVSDIPWPHTLFQVTSVIYIVELSP